jgi:hypothetical protein
LIRSNKIKQFLRLKGWVTVGNYRTREIRKDYEWVNRRSSSKKTIFREIGGVMSMFEQRRVERYESLDNKIEYALDPFSGDSIFEAELVNYCETGLCILSSHLLSVGQEITLRDFMSFSSRTGVVIWIVEDEETGGFDKSDQGLFKVGLQFA